MNGVSELWLALPLVAGVGFAQMVEYYRVKLARLRFRGEQLEKAVTFVKVHQQALDEFTNLAEPSARLKGTLIEFGRQVSSEDTAHSLFSRAAHLGASGAAPSDLALATLNDLDTLREHRPGQAQIFDKAVRCGLFGALLRWPEMNEAFDRAFAHLVVDQEREVANAVSASESFRS